MSTKNETAEARTAQSCGHTPGPWRIQADPEFAHRHPFHDYRLITTDHELSSFSESHGWCFEDNAGEVICDMRDGVHQQANARLIAAAPELVAALKRIVECADAALTSPDDAGYQADAWDAVTDARSALQKAGCV